VLFRSPKQRDDTQVKGATVHRHPIQSISCLYALFHPWERTIIALVRSRNQMDVVRKRQ